MYDNQALAPAQGFRGNIQAADYNPTVEETIDRRIAYLEAEISRLKQLKIDVSAIAGVRINDLRNAMSL